MFLKKVEEDKSHLNPQSKTTTVVNSDGTTETVIEYNDDYILWMWGPDTLARYKKDQALGIKHPKIYVLKKPGFISRIITAIINFSKWLFK
jgi:hypothetical protein